MQIARFGMQVPTSCSISHEITISAKPMLIMLHNFEHNINKTVHVHMFFHLSVGSDSPTSSDSPTGSQPLTSSESSTGSESITDFDSLAAGLASGLVAAATIPSIVAVIATVLFIIVLCAYIHLRMKMQSNIAALKFATLQSPPISNQTTGNIYEGSIYKDAELSQEAQQHDTSI